MEPLVMTEDVGVMTALKPNGFGCQNGDNDAQWSNPVARLAHNQEVGRSNRLCATNAGHAVVVQRMIHNHVCVGSTPTPATKGPMR